MPNSLDLANALRILIVGVLVGPPVGAVVGFGAFSVTHACGFSPLPLRGFEGLLLFPFHLVLALFVGVFLVPGAVWLAYLTSTLYAVESSALFVFANFFAPSRWPRALLGALCGRMPVYIAWGPHFPNAPLTNLGNVAGFLPAAGPISGWVCALICERAGWTR